MKSTTCSRRVRVERGVYRQPNGKYAVCFRHAGRLRFRTTGFDLDCAPAATSADLGRPTRPGAAARPAAALSDPCGELA